MEVANELVEEAWEAAKEEKGRLAEKLAWHAAKFPQIFTIKA
jgi:hypothetical protein